MHHNPVDFNRAQAMRWIRTATIEPAVRIVERLTEKSNSRTKPLPNPMDPNDLVLSEMHTRQVAQLIRAAHAIYLYSRSDRRVDQVFRITFHDKTRSVAVLNAGNYIQMVLGGKRTNSPITIEQSPTVFQVLLWHHCINLVCEHVNRKKLSARMNYQVGHVIGYVVYHVTRAWGLLLRTVSDAPLQTLLSPYLWFNTEDCMYEQLSKKRGFAPLSQRTTFLLKPNQFPTVPTWTRLQGDELTNRLCNATYRVRYDEEAEGHRHE